MLADVYKAGKHDYQELQEILNDQHLLYESYGVLLANLMAANEKMNGHEIDWNPLEYIETNYETDRTRKEDVRPWVFQVGTVD